MKGNSRMECDRLSELYSLYVYDDVTDEERRLVSRHINECEACAKEVNELRETLQILHLEPEITVPQNFETELENQVYKQIAAETVRQTNRNFIVKLLENFLFRRSLAWGATIAIALTIGVFFGALQFSRTGTMETSVPTFASSAFASSVSPDELLKQHFQTGIQAQVDDEILILNLAEDKLRVKETLERLSDVNLEPQMASVVYEELSRFDERFKGGI